MDRWSGIVQINNRQNMQTIKKGDTVSKVTPEQMNYVNNKISIFTQMNEEFHELLRKVKAYVQKQAITIPNNCKPNISWGFAESGCSMHLSDTAYCSASFNFNVKLPKEITKEFSVFEKEKARRRDVAESIRERIVFSDSVDILKILKELK